MRLFIAVNVPLPLRLKVDQLRQDLAGKLAAAKADVKWVRLEQLHITLQFLGDVASSKLPPLTEALEHTLGGSGEFALELNGLGCFPDSGPVKVIWLGIRQGHERLKSLVEAVVGACEQSGLIVERRAFSPHLTLGRVKGLRRGGKIRALAATQVFKAGHLNVAAVELMQSTLSASGPTYTALHSVGLKRDLFQ